MVWKIEAKHPLGCDRDAGLYVTKTGNQRDNFEFLVKYMHNSDLCFMFYAKPIAERKLNEQEKKINPGCDLSIRWQVSCREKWYERKTIIHDALVAYSHAVDGFSHKTDGEWFKSIVELEQVAIIHGR